MRFFLIKVYQGFHKNIKQHNCNNKKCFFSAKSAYSIRMISEGSCDTKDWSIMDAENSSLPHRNKLHFKIYLKYKTVVLNCNNISQYCCIFDAALVSRKDVFQKSYHIYVCIGYYHALNGCFKASLSTTYIGSNLLRQQLKWCLISDPFHL